MASSQLVAGVSPLRPGCLPENVTSQEAPRRSYSCSYASWGWLEPSRPLLRQAGFRRESSLQPLFLARLPALLRSGQYGVISSNAAPDTSNDDLSDSEESLMAMTSVIGSRVANSNNLPENLGASLLSPDRPAPVGADMMRLFNDAQQNMLYLNKQRVMAMEELQKAERDREVLLAKLSQKEAESLALEAERDLLEQRLKSAEAAIAVAESKAGGAVFRVGDKKDPKADPPALWSSLLLRLESMVLGEVISKGQAGALRELVWRQDMRAAELYVELKDQPDAEVSKGLLALLGQQSRPGVHVVHICTELAPVAQAGSLAGELLGLCRALRRKGHLVEVILPKYKGLDLRSVDDLRESQKQLHSFYDGAWVKNEVWTGTVYGVPVVFLDPQSPKNLFSRDRFYDYEDDYERFAYFSRAALEYVLKSGNQPDVLHLHNWQTALVAPLFWDIYASQGLNNTRIMFTCHDFKYQCTVPPEKLAVVGLDHWQLNRSDRLQDNQNPELVNLLKGGIVYSNKVTTVSPVYATDVKTNYGHGMEPTLQLHAGKFQGILSGIDDSMWNPAKDATLPAQFTAGDLSGKETCKAELRSRMNFPPALLETPLVGCVAPSVNEIELELIKAALTTAMNMGAQFVFLGSSRAPKVQVQLEDLAREFQDKNVKLNIRFDSDLARLICAGADIMVCPGIFDPANQQQLFAYKYGALPVARQIYSHWDSVFDVDDATRGKDVAAGFPFCSDKPGDVAAALTRAIKRKVQDPQGWQALVNTAMRADFSWDGKSSDTYLDAYYAIRRCA